jgi:hypothetical protein
MEMARYSLDLGAFYFNILQISKSCVPPGETCANTTCMCTQTSPYFSGTCSHWARGACRRKMYLCYYPPTDFIWRNYSDYDILFCSIGTDDPSCNGTLPSPPSCPRKAESKISRLALPWLLRLQLFPPTARPAQVSACRALSAHRSADRIRPRLRMSTSWAGLANERTGPGWFGRVRSM